MKSAEETLKEIKVGIQSIQQDNKIDRVKTYEEIDKVLAYQYEDLYNLDDDTRRNMAFALCQYAFDMKRQENRYEAFLHYVEDYLRSYVIRDAKNYFDDTKFVKYDTQYSTVVDNNDYLVEIEKEKRVIQIKLDSIKGLSSLAQKMADKLTYKVFNRD